MRDAMQAPFQRYVSSGTPLLRAVRSGIEDQAIFLTVGTMECCGAAPHHPIKEVTDASSAALPQEKGVWIPLDCFREVAQGPGAGREIAYGRFEIAAEL